MTVNTVPAVSLLFAIGHKAKLRPVFNCYSLCHDLIGGDSPRIDFARVGRGGGVGRGLGVTLGRGVGVGLAVGVGVGVAVALAVGVGVAVTVAVAVAVAVGVGVGLGPAVTSTVPGPANSGSGLGAPLFGLPYTPGGCGIPFTTKEAMTSGDPVKLRLIIEPLTRTKPTVSVMGPICCSPLKRQRSAADLGQRTATLNHAGKDCALVVAANAQSVEAQKHQAFPGQRADPHSLCRRDCRQYPTLRCQGARYWPWPPSCVVLENDRATVAPVYSAVGSDGRIGGCAVISEEQGRASKVLCRAAVDGETAIGRRRAAS